MVDIVPVLRVNDYSIKIYEVLDLAPLRLILESPTHTELFKSSVSKGIEDLFPYGFGVI